MALQVAQHLLGCKEPLKAVIKELMKISSGSCTDVSLAETALQTMIIDLAMRRSFAAKGGERTTDAVTGSGICCAMQCEG